MLLDLEGELNSPQLEAVRTAEGPLLIIAGAGSGKTRVITYRIARMLERGIPQHAILALTFTNKAAREMEKRVRELTGKKLQSLTVSTFHAFGVKILRKEIEALGYRENFSIYDETDRTELIKESLRESRLGADRLNRACLYALGELFSNIKTGRYTWADAPGTEAAPDPSAYEGVYREYQHGLKVFNALDFDDLLVLPIELFEKHPETLAKYRNRFRYIMVDEFQDTSLIQYRLLKLLALGNSPGSGAAGESGLPNICAVGDDDQSIYSWRGANYENLLRFEEDFPGCREIKLEQNYRSTTTILEAANGVIAHNTRRKEKTLWSGNTGGRPIVLHHPENESDEAGFIAAQIKEHMMREGLHYGDFGILLRTNSMTRAIEEALLESNIPYRVSGGQSFFSRKEIKDIISYLKVIANFHDDINLMRIINTPRRGIGKSTVELISGAARKNQGPAGGNRDSTRGSQGSAGGNRGSLWSAMERLVRLPEGVASPLPAKTRGELDVFMSMLEAFRERILSDPRNLAEKIRNLTDKIDYWSYLVAEFGREEKTARWKFANIEYLIQSVEHWENDPDNFETGLYAWLNRISLITNSRDDDDGDTGKVNIMTIHAAKGLEFPVVFIAGAEEGIIPHTRSMEEDGEDPGAPEEERRLFYVAITRAREKLYITSCARRRRLQDVITCAPSPFLEEIPSHLVLLYNEGGETENSVEAVDFFAQIRGQFS
ncbi:MAG: exodeoxyribonuclease V subunit gamma [Treponema sp.]|jgi:DNA helicase-2/ATP-dependent DNA helicase PcrA|nr:exodeoxyribonuclease V subunit gamma [Treponema sp.]